MNKAGEFGESHTASQLRALIARGYKFIHPRTASGEIAAVVGVRPHDDVVDVVRLHAQDEVIATRLPGDGQDVLTPTRVLWQRSGGAAEVLDQLLGLPDGHTPGSISAPVEESPVVPPARSAASTRGGCWVPIRPGRVRWQPTTA